MGATFNVEGWCCPKLQIFIRSAKPTFRRREYYGFLFTSHYLTGALKLSPIMEGDHSDLLKWRNTKWIHSAKKKNALVAILKPHHCLLQCYFFDAAHIFNLPPLKEFGGLNKKVMKISPNLTLQEVVETICSKYKVANPERYATICDQTFPQYPNCGTTYWSKNEEIGKLKIQLHYTNSIEFEHFWICLASSATVGIIFV